MFDGRCPKITRKFIDAKSKLILISDLNGLTMLKNSLNHSMKKKRNSGVIIEESGTDSIAKSNQFSSNKDTVKRKIIYFISATLIEVHLFIFIFEKIMCQ